MSAEHDIVAVYQELLLGGSSYRVDFLDLPEQADLDLYLAFDQGGGGKTEVEVGGITLETKIPWDLLFIARCRGGECTAESWRATDSGVEPFEEHRPSVVFDWQQDFVELSYCPVYLGAPDCGGLPVAIEALTARPGGQIVDTSPFAQPSDPTEQRAKLVIVFNNLFHGDMPAAIAWYDGDFPDKTKFNPGQRECNCAEEEHCCSLGGPRYLLDMVEKYRIPVVIHDLHMDVLPGLEYLGITERLRRLWTEGLLDLPDTLTYGYFMPWQPQGVDAVAIDLSQQIRQELLDMAPPAPNGGDSPRIFSPYEGRVRVEDLATLADEGYDAIVGLAYYRHWFDQPDQVYTDGELLQRVEDSKKIQDVTVTTAGGESELARIQAIFVPEAQGIHTDERWCCGPACGRPAPECVGTATKEDLWDLASDKEYDFLYSMMLGHDDGLHLYWRRGLLDQAVNPDQHQHFNIGADIQLTPFLFPNVIERNLRWLAAHPWIEVVTLTELLERAESEPAWTSAKTIERASEEAHLIVPRCGERDYNTYFEFFYEGETEAGERWSCLVPCDTPIEGYAGYRVHVEPGTLGPEMRTVVAATQNALHSAPQENPLTDLAWLSYFVANAEQTQHKILAGDDGTMICDDGACAYGGCELEPGEDGGAHLSTVSKLRANFLGQAGKLTAAAEWADCLSGTEQVSECVLSEAYGTECRVSFQGDVGTALECDLDFDGELEALLVNRQVLALFENDGGRLEHAFLYDEETGRAIQAVAPFSQHFGLLEPPGSCGDYGDGSCVYNDERCCFEEGEVAISLLTESTAWSGAFVEMTRDRSFSPTRLFADPYELVGVGGGALTYRHPDSETSREEGKMYLEKTFRLTGSEIRSEYSVSGLAEEGSRFEIGFGLPVDMESMLRRDAWFLVEELDTVGWRVVGSAEAEVGWSDDIPTFNEIRSVSFSESPVRDLEAGGVLGDEKANVHPFPYNSVVLAFDSKDVNQGGDFTVRLSLRPEEPHLPRDTLLALDFSGSMEASACPGCRPKHEVLKEAVEVFVQLYRVLARGEDRLGVLTFRQDVGGYPSFQEPLQEMSEEGVLALIEDLGMQDPNGLTAMGGALQHSMRVQQDPDQPRQRDVVLFTDGLQNVNPMVRQIDGRWQMVHEPGRRDSNLDVQDPPVELIPQIPIKTVGVGAREDFVNLLRDISAASHEDDHFALVTTAPDDDLRRFFVEALLDVFSEDLQVTSYRKSRLGAGGAVETFPVDRAARQLVLQLSWDRALEEPLTLRVTRDGHDVTAHPRATLEERDFYSLYAIELANPTVGEELSAGGEWTVSVHGPEGALYEVAAIVRQEPFGSRLSLRRDKLRVGQPIEPVVDLAIDGQPVTGATVRARVLAPQVGVGTALSLAPTPDLSSVPDDSGPTAGSKKLDVLQKTADFWQQLQPVASAWRTLHDLGNGSYSAAFGETSVPGTYRVEVKIGVDHETLGELRREASQTALVEIGALDLRRSEVRLIRPEEPTDHDPVRLTLRPRDAAGNYLGPDSGDQIVVDATPGHVVRVEDRLDGSYHVTLGGLSPESEVRIQVRNEELYGGSITGLAEPRRFRFGLFADWSEPSAGFAAGVGGDVGFEASLEVSLKENLSLNGVLSRYRMDPGPEILGSALYLRGYRPWRKGSLFGEVGAGWFDPEGQDGAVGVGLGVGTSWPLGARWHGEAGSRFLHLFNSGDGNSGDSLEMLTFQVGLRYGF